MCLKFYDSFIILYADDTALCLNDHDASTLILKVNIELQNIFDYCTSNSLILNLNKCEAVVFNAKDPKLFDNKLILGGSPLKVVSEYRYLGYIIDEQLKFKHQINNIISKLSSCNFALSRASNFIPKKSLMLYCTNQLGFHIYFTINS